MYDTICFRVLHPEVVPGSPIHEGGRPHPSSEDTFLAEGSNGNEVKLRTGLIYKDGVVSAVVRKNGLYLETSGARSPLAPGAPNVDVVTSAGECLDRVDLTEEHLRSVGVRTNLSEAFLSKVHVCQDIVVDAPYGDYLRALQACGLQKLSPSDLKRFAPFGEKVPQQSELPLDEHTYGRTWSYRANVVYSKTGHLLSRKAHREYAGEVQRAIGGRSVLRFENRLNKASAVKRHLGIERGKDLYVHWDMVAENRKRFLDETFGSGDDSGSCVNDIATAGLLSLVESIVEVHGKGKTSAFIALAVLGLAAQLEDGQDVEGLMAIFLAAGVRRAGLKEAIDNVIAFSAQGDVTTGALKRELRERLLGGGFTWPGP